MSIAFPVRLGAAENALIDQLKSLGADATAERITVAGLPTRRVEAYHYTDLKLLLKAIPPLAQAANAAGVSALDIAGAQRLAIVNGVIQAAPAAVAGVIIGKAEGTALSTRDDVLVHLNGALVEESLTLTLEGPIDHVIQVDRRIEGDAAHAADSLKVFVADGASATIIETFSGSDAAHVGNHATYVTLGKDARLTHVTVDLSARAVSHFATNEYQVGENAQLRTLVVHAGAGLARTHLFPRYAGAGAHGDITGLNLVSDGQHSDITMMAEHAVPQTSSQPLFKSIARGRGKSIVQGKLVVARDAQKTDAKFMHQGLMLSDEAEILSKPELEIYADDVVCGHGSTCGKLDEDSLFYLMSRGIPQAEAETMLVRGFLEELVDPIEDEALAEALHGVIDGWLLGK
ncbi:Iron-regulated ABC transporter permease protein SufD [Devosia sp. YR412]|uniref:Fe-S cluster assembly protein SufD n=1 Tax=Devosia sp. YR412 TaxID=1881030 RepID=UPI0008D19DDF|nr:Fe-S cluster assembly protein SufD [Devosia sp. YR412]SEQ39100.1 Iron-regulated ABC transporter permease protein SufD [Devosia sp. YR412]